MNITVYTVCFNEEKMLPHFLNYYSKIANKIVVYDNQSTDKSVDICKSYPNTEVHSFDTQGKLSEITLTQIRSNCWKNDTADFAIVCDVDEFLYAPNLKKFLQENEDYDVFQPLGFNMASSKFPEDYSRPITDQIKRGTYAINFSKMVLFKPQKIREMNYGPGSHFANPIGKGSINIFRSLEHGGVLKLLHYKNLGFEYFSNRNKFISSRLSEEFKKYGYGFHYNLSRAKQRKRFLKSLLLSQNCIDSSSLTWITKTLIAIKRMKKEKPLMLPSSPK